MKSAKTEHSFHLEDGATLVHLTGIVIWRVTDDGFDVDTDYAALMKDKGGNYTLALAVTSDILGIKPKIAPRTVVTGAGALEWARYELEKMTERLAGLGVEVATTERASGASSKEAIQAAFTWMDEELCRQARARAELLNASMAARS